MSHCGPFLYFVRTTGYCSCSSSRRKATTERADQSARPICSQKDCQDLMDKKPVELEATKRLF
jgi:hypothetical protein